MTKQKAKLHKLAQGAPDNTLAVILVHGLRGDPERTWKNKHEARALVDLLRQDSELCTADYYSFGYKTGLMPLQYSFKEAAELLHTEINFRLAGRKLLFIAHSMGGLIVRQYALDRCSASDEKTFSHILGSVYLAVPFKGSQLAVRLPKLVSNLQILSLRWENRLLIELEDSWNKFLSSADKTPFQHKIMELYFCGERDRIVNRLSAFPMTLGEQNNTFSVDENHTSICKMKPDDTVLVALQSFIREIKNKLTNQAMVLHVHGFSKWEYDQTATHTLDWTPHFDVYSSPRKLPDEAQWSILSNELKPIAHHLASNRSRYDGLLRIYSKLCLPGGVLLGSRFPNTSGAVLEVYQESHQEDCKTTEIWSSHKAASGYQINSAKKQTETPNISRRGVIALSVNNNIATPVLHYMQELAIDYHSFIDLSPPGGAGRNSIKNAEEAVAFAKQTKAAADQLKAEGVEELYLFLNCPFALSVFIGHYMTALSPIQVFDYAHPHYVPACIL
jgi:hypothetical protein